MTRTISLKSGAVYSGTTALDIVEQMREGDFDPPPTVRDYIVRATARASHYFGTTLRIHPNTGTEAELAEEFIAQAIAKGFAEEILSS